MDKEGSPGGGEELEKTPTEALLLWYACARANLEGEGGPGGPLLLLLWDKKQHAVHAKRGSRCAL